MKSFITCALVVAFSTFSFAADEVINSEAQPVISTSAVPNTEEQTPLNINVVKKASEAPPASTRILLTGVIISAMLGAAYFFVRKYKTSNTINKSNMQIKVLTQHYLGPKKSLAIIHVAGESILVGITDSNISMIKSLSLIDDEVPITTPKTFADAMMKPAAKSGASALMNGNTASELNDNELEEEFSFAGLKDSVSKKLKSMRSI